jgi:nitrogen fixation NifU-like protein
MNELEELYREVILDHRRNPRNFGTLDDADRIVEGVNPLCGDKLRLYIRLDDGKIDDIRFQGTGCAISVASTSLMTERVKGTRIEEALALQESVHSLLTSESTSDEASLGKLAALSGVREFPSRVKCAALSWHALKSGLTEGAGEVSTE